MDARGLASRATLIATLAGLLVAGLSAAAQPTGADGGAALASIRKAVESDGVRGRLVERTPGRYLFVPDGEDLVLPVVNPERVAAAAVGPMLQISGRVDAESGKLELGNVRLDLAPSSSGQPLARAAAEPAAATLAEPDALARELDAIVADFAGTVNRSLAPGAMSVEDLKPEGGGAIAAQDRRTTANLAKLYARARETDNAAVQDATIARYAEVRQTLKSLYGTYDNYHPWSYDQIYRNANAAVAIGRPDRSQAICSGVLIGADLVLTAGHCFEDHSPEDLEVWFDFVQDRDNLHEPQRRRIGTMVAPSLDKREAFEDQAFGRDLFDYAIVRFAQEGDEPLIPPVPLPSCQIEPAASVPADAPAEVQAAWPGLLAEWEARCVRRPQCLSDARALRGDAVYVIGFPQGARETVHDNGRVYMPYQLTQSEFEKLSLEIALDYKEHPDREQILTEFTDSYVPQASRFVLEDVRYGGQPKIGIVADTFRGNSGSPVYDRGGDNHCLVGLLIGGAEDRGQRLLASWLHHEAVLPISAILRDLQAHEDTKALIDGELLDIR